MLVQRIFSQIDALKIWIQEAKFHNKVITLPVELQKRELMKRVESTQLQKKNLKHLSLKYSPQGRSKAQFLRLLYILAH